MTEWLACPNICKANFKNMVWCIIHRRHICATSFFTNFNFCGHPIWLMRGIEFLGCNKSSQDVGKEARFCPVLIHIHRRSAVSLKHYEVKSRIKHVTQRCLQSQISARLQWTKTLKNSYELLNSGWIYWVMGITKITLLPKQHFN